MKKHTLSALISLSLSVGYISSTNAGQQYFQSRSDAMGGTGVASAHYLSAPLMNPALLARFSHTDNVGILLPAIGAQIDDNSDTIDSINTASDLINELNKYNSNSPQARATARQLANELEMLDNEKIPVQVGLAGVIAVPNETVSFALFTNTYLDLQVAADISDSDIQALRGQNPAAIDELDSTITLHGVGVTDLGISLASKFILGNTPVYVGLSPKVQAIGFYQYTDSIDNFDASNLEKDGTMDDDVAFNIDAGFVVEPNKHFTFGLVAKNMLEHQVSNASETFRYEIKPQITTGFALHSEWLTAAVDIDITQSDTLSNKKPSQYTRLGAEMDAWGWLQFRGGFRYDLNDNDSNQITFGMGLSPFSILHIDLTGMLSEDETYGFVAQTALTF
ncbi:conjugal transfer protein TraF [Moritella sp. 24]|uniref:conjugal transfer protein TraF n=1 Tax=Moritella sp. 24 TaxID=2746230 RepID=UPI001BA84350|nr:conjugal transfer protein TraF [Moritella sp. 24]QUM75193.1 conjugal transfer protein TraF [Moritella sp. 24]